MSNYEYSSYSSSSNAGGAGGSNAANGIFSQVDANNDGSIDRTEFSNWLGNAAGGAGGAGQVGVSAGGAGGSYESSSYSSTGGAGGAGYGVEAGLSGLAGGSSYESSSYSSGAGFDAAAAGGAGAGFQASSFESSSSSGGAGFEGGAISQAAGYTSETNAAWSRYGADVRGAGLYIDSNPQIIRRQAPGGVQTYTQNIKVRFLQPPPIPPPGVSQPLSIFSRHPNERHSLSSHSSSKRSDHPSHHHHHPFASSNRHPLFLSLPHSFSVNDHHSHQRRKLLKQSFASLLPCPCHLDRSSSNVCQLPQLAHVSRFLLSIALIHCSARCRFQVTSSSNDGSHTELLPNERPLFNALLPPRVTPTLATSSSNTRPLKSVLSVNSNVWVLLKKTHKRTFNATELNCSMPKASCNKPVQLVLLKTS